MTRVSVAVWLSLATMGCGSGPRGTPDGGGRDAAVVPPGDAGRDAMGSMAGDAGVTAEGSVAALANALCEAELACVGAHPTELWLPSDCEGVQRTFALALLTGARSAIGRGEAVFDATRLDACLDAIVAAPCDA